MRLSELLRNFGQESNVPVDFMGAPLYAQGVRIVCCALMCWLAACAVTQAQSQPAVGTCLGGNCVLGAPAVPRHDLGLRPQKARGFARGAAWFGLISGALTLGGSIAIAMVDEPEHETITRGAWLGYTALALPIVALGSYTTRKRARLKVGYQSIRTFGWTAYTGAVSNGVMHVYLAFVDTQPSAGFTIGLGVMSLMAFLPHAFDAYVTSRAARAKGLSWAPAPGGFVVRF